MIGLFALGLVLAAAGVVFAIILWKGNQKLTRTRNWEPTQAVVLSSWVDQDAPSGRYGFHLRYEYLHAGQRYVGDRIKELDKTYRDKAEAEDLQQVYRPGSKHECYVNPLRPEQVVLRHGTRAAGYSLWFPLLFAVGGAGMMWRALVRRSELGDPGAAKRSEG